MFAFSGHLVKSTCTFQIEWGTARLFTLFFQVAILEHIVHSVPFIAALITNTIINIKIVKRLIRSPGENGNQRNQQIKQRITLMLLANSVIFFSCLAPKHILLIFWSPLNFSYSAQRYYTRTLTILVMVNSAINPILYGLASPSYCRGFLKAFGIVKNQIEPMEDRETERPREHQAINL